MRFDDGDDMYNVSIQDVRRNQINACNERVDCSTRHHDFIFNKTLTSHIPNPNPFQWVFELIVDTENASISN